MVDAPKRSVGETITQLVVIAILIAILIGAVIILRQYIDSHNASDPPSARDSYNFICCSNMSPNAVYHPGENVRLSWTPIKSPPGYTPSKLIRLTVSLSSSFPSAKAIMSAIEAGSFSTSSGPFVVKSVPNYVPNQYGELPHSAIRIPDNARSGFYDLVTTARQANYSNTEGTIIKIHD